VYNKSTRTISQAINNLAKYEYIKIYIDVGNGNKRRLYVILENYFKMMKLSPKQRKSIYEKMDRTSSHISRGGIEENCDTPMEENCEYNNTSDNTNNTTEVYDIKELFEKFYSKWRIK
jgi:hypothetical protein